jgi:hypothetical protein
MRRLDRRTVVAGITSILAECGGGATDGNAFYARGYGGPAPPRRGAHSPIVPGDVRRLRVGDFLGESRTDTDHSSLPAERRPREWRSPVRIDGGSPRRGLSTGDGVDFELEDADLDLVDVSVEHANG